MQRGPVHEDVVNGDAGRVRGETLERISALVLEKPGLNIQEISDASGIQRTAVNHHIRRMVRDGEVVRRRQGLHVLHFPRGMEPMRVKALSFLRVPSVLLVVQELHGNPAIPWGVIAQRLLVTERTVRRAVQTLEAEDLLRVERGGRGRRVCHLHPELRMVLVRWGTENTGEIE